MTLDCYRVGCNGDFQPSAREGELYRCESCGGTLAAGPTKTLADGDGPVAQLAAVLVDRAEGSHA